MAQTHIILYTSRQNQFAISRYLIICTTQYKVICIVKYQKMLLLRKVLEERNLSRSLENQKKRRDYEI